MKKKKVMIVFSEGGENGGPFVSHKRIIESVLKEEYNFVKLIIPKGRLKVVNFKLFFNLINQIKKEKPDVIHCNGLQLQGFHCMIAAFVCGVPNRVVAIHGSSMEATSFSKIKLFIMNVLEHFTLLLSTSFFGVSEYTTNWKRLKKFRKKSFGTVYNLTPDINYKKIKKGKIRKELGIDPDKIIVVSTARITAEKGFDTFKDVIKYYNKSSICYLIVGDGDYKNYLEQELSEEIKERRVFLLGYREDILDILSDSDIFMLLTHHENLSMSLLEALKLNLPIIATNVGGNPEIVFNNINGVLVDNYDVDSAVNALKKVIKNREFYSQNCGNICKKFDTEKTLKKLKLIYDYDPKSKMSINEYMSKKGALFYEK